MDENESAQTPHHVSNVSIGFERSLNSRGRLCGNNNLRRNCRLYAAIFIYLFEYDFEYILRWSKSMNTEKFPIRLLEYEYDLEHGVRFGI